MSLHDIMRIRSSAPSQGPSYVFELSRPSVPHTKAPDLPLGSQPKETLQWLSSAVVSGFPEFLRALALDELFRAAKNPRHQEIARQTFTTLSKPKREMEKAALARIAEPNAIIATPTRIESMNDLRLATVNGKCPGSMLGLDDIRSSYFLNQKSLINALLTSAR